MQRFRLKAFCAETLDSRYLNGIGKSGTTPNALKAGEYTMAELEHHAKHDRGIWGDRCSAILFAIDTGHLTKEPV